MSKRDLDDAVPDPPPSNGTTTANGVARAPSSNGVDASSSDPSSVPPPQPARDSHTHPHPFASDPQLSLPSSYYSLSTQSVTSLTSSRPAPPSPAVSRRTSGLSRTSSRPVSGMSPTASSRPASGIQHSRSVSGAGSHPASGTVQPTTTTSFPRHSHDRRSNLAPIVPPSDPDRIPVEPTPMSAQATAPPTPTTAPTLIYIRDYGFALSDPRFSGQGSHVPRANRPTFLARRLASSSESTPTSSSEGDDDDDDDDGYEDIDEGDDEEGEGMSVDVVQMTWEDVVDDGTNGWGECKWGFSRAWEFGRASDTGATPSGLGFPSRGDLDRNFGGEGEYEDMEIDEEGEAMSDEEGEDEGNAESEPPLFPGLYRALYDFEPEGTAEMKLDEDQVVRVIGRGGGVGWAVVVKDGLKDTGVHALVPESYLEPVRLDGEEEDT